MFKNVIKTSRNGVYIAEIGINHNGDVDIAYRLVDKARDAGADIVKFQFITPELLVSPYANSLLEYGSEKEHETGVLDFFRKFMLDIASYRKLQQYVEQRGMLFLMSVFDIAGVDIMEELGVSLYKLASSELTNHTLIKQIAETNKPLILSTGLSYDFEIDMAVDLFKKHSNADIYLMHCVSLYPVPDDQLNLQRISVLKKRYNCEVGFSDHTTGISAHTLAVAAGATFFEKHFTVDRKYDCPDKVVSITADEFFRYINSAEEAFVMYGDGELSFKESEGEVARAARRSLFAQHDIHRGQVVQENDLISLRPGIGIPDYRSHEIIGKTAKVDIKKNYLIKKEYFE